MSRRLRILEKELGVPLLIPDGRKIRPTAIGQELAQALSQPLADIEQGKRFVSDLLGGDTLRIEGDAPWLDKLDLPLGELLKRYAPQPGAAAPKP